MQKMQVVELLGTVALIHKDADGGVDVRLVNLDTNHITKLYFSSASWIKLCTAIRDVISEHTKEVAK